MGIREIRWEWRGTRLTIHVKVGDEARLVRNLKGEAAPMQDSARAESSARSDWQTCTTRCTHAFLLNHRTGCTVFRAIVVFAMTTMARSFTTHPIFLVVHRVRFGPDSCESGPNPAPDSPNLSIAASPGWHAFACGYTHRNFFQTSSSYCLASGRLMLIGSEVWYFLWKAKLSKMFGIFFFFGKTTGSFEKKTLTQLSGLKKKRKKTGGFNVEPQFWLSSWVSISANEASIRAVQSLAYSSVTAAHNTMETCKTKLWSFRKSSPEPDRCRWLL